MARLRQMLALSLLLFVAAAGVLFASESLQERIVYSVSFEPITSDLFRQQRISGENVAVIKEFSEEYGIAPSSVIAAVMAVNRFDLGRDELEQFDMDEWNRLDAYLAENRGEEYESLRSAYEAIWKDVKCFPVPESKTNPDATVSFEDSWMYERTYGGKRGHEGTDLMANINERGYYPVVSMTDGVIEKIGWLEKGGYRIGIRSASGGYYYYAHLYAYAQDYQVGDAVRAGELIAYMGDSGYGEEGTVGQFDVHLHVGIYVNNADGEEISVNPYPVMLFYEQKKLQFDY